MRWLNIDDTVLDKFGERIFVVDLAYGSRQQIEEFFKLTHSQRRWHQRPVLLKQAQPDHLPRA